MKIETFALMLSAFALSVSIVLLIIGDGSKEYKQEVTNPTDAQIMESRVYVSDYDHRLKEATKAINSCSRYLADCKRMAYDAYSIEYNSFGDISKDVKAEYQHHKSISIKPLTMEINNVWK